MIQTSLNPLFLVNDFKKDCKRLILYLDYIEHKKFYDKKRSCKYFNYLLKDILKTYRFPKEESDEAYKIIINNTKQSDIKKVSNMYWENFEDMDESIYSVMKDLNELYRHFDSFRELLDYFMEQNVKNIEQIIEQKQLTAVPQHANFTNKLTVILTLIIILFTLLMITFFLYKVKYKINLFFS
ncbi:hypothetical protein PGO_002700 [Plasmodium gonderi]|uniref:Variable surface protein n=1 Tax=Plasmodium gonderi TaxID=77519 RepID=A0A1Y1JSE5_PLAGO|nr:hypothetical protein PGO_002700 [Plasmodium gonderi]GAW84385.1 hypothetical protein PGO_002700 [Plasmodium gonderi]